ncbi:MAG: Eco57I restriction-modification methylase domain-containing protein [Selenomonadaceae bacterium]|nr:Eco57I restriction-modification methylase domain-containing protein [Selenomonadaceae bacterium]
MDKTKIKPYKKISPMIYVYTTPDVNYHKGWIKIGYTEQEVKTRIYQQTSTADIKFKIEWQSEARYTDGSGEYFSDRDFHRYLIDNFNIQFRKEWFKIDPTKARDIFYRFRDRDDRSLNENYQLRTEQQAAVDQTINYFEKNLASEFLWNAKPRFGKVLSAYELIRRMNLKKVLIVTNRPSVSNSWLDDFNKFIAWQTDYKFVSDNDALKGKKNIFTQDELESNESEKFIAFESLQGLKGSIYFGGTLDKLKWIAKTDWELLIIDEAHEGVDTFKTDRAFDNIKRKFTLHLSGTPFKAIANQKFSADQIFNWTYEDEQQSKISWNGSTANPYELMPRLNFFTYKLSDAIIDKVNQGLYITDEINVDYAFDLNEFFRVEGEKFIYESDVKKFLDTLTTNEKFPFSTENLRNELSHTFWLFDRVNSAKAMKNLLEKHKIFGEYEIVLAAGDGKTNDSVNDDKYIRQSFDRVKKAISTHDKTITLSVGQLTTGVTIKAWTAVLMLSNMTSATEYIQAAFRAQNPFTQEIDGKIYRKENCYVFDFAPARSLMIINEYTNSLNVDGESSEDKIKRGGGSSEDKIKRLINFMPVIAEDDNGRMVELDAAEILKIPTKIKVDHVVESGFMSNFLFDNVSNIFSASAAVREILEKVPPKENFSDKKNRGAMNNIEGLFINTAGDVAIPNEIIINKTDAIFGRKIYELETIEEMIDQSDQKTLPKKIVEAIKPTIETSIKDNYNLNQNQVKRLTKKIDNAAHKTFDNLNDDYTRRKKIIAIEATEDTAEKLAALSEDFQQKLIETTQKFLEESTQEIIRDVEIQREESFKRSAENDMRAHLRGFSRTIPSFIMAFSDSDHNGGRDIKLKNLETITTDEIFLEVTGITKDDFKFLRDGGERFNESTGKTEIFKGHLINEIIFDEAIQKFLDTKDRLANYFEEDHNEDIFNYIPPQKTNQIYTPRLIVNIMLDAAQIEISDLFDNPKRIFIDIYMKSGLYITEIVKRLYRSNKMKKFFPNDHDRLKHILENQVYGCAPTEIIYRIAKAYIFGASDSLKNISMKNFICANTIDYVNAGRLDKFLKIFLKVARTINEVLIKSDERIKKFGEVFTPKNIVDLMLNQIEDLNSKTILEPAAGEGAFLIEILRRKLQETTTIEKMLLALKSIYGIEKQADNVKITKENLKMIFLEHYEKIFDKTLDEESEIFAEMTAIINKNIICGDALEFFESLRNIFNDNLIDPYELQNGFIIGNPPYQEDRNKGNENYASPIYHRFLEESFKACDQVMMIHPARFLFNAGATPKDFNKKMLNDEHLKVIFYEPDSSKIFSNVDIKGGIAITFHDNNQNFGAIKIFIPFKELRSIYQKVVVDNKNFQPLSKIMYSRTSYRLTDKVHLDYPNAKDKLSKGHFYDMSTHIFTSIPNIFFDEQPNDDHEYIKILGRQNNERVYKWIRKDYVIDHETLYKFKVIVPDSNGSGAIKEVLTTPLVGEPLVGEPLVGYTETFLSVGAFDSEAEAVAALKFIKTKFARVLLGILKVTQHNPPETWAKVPLQDFTTNSDIDWAKSIAEIDQKLYKKYNLSTEEINFIESNVKAMT